MEPASYAQLALTFRIEDGKTVDLDYEDCH